MVNLSVLPNINNKFQNIFHTKPKNIAIPTAIIAGVSVKLKSQPTEDSFELTQKSENLNNKKFISEFIYGNNPSIENVMKTHDFTQYGKKGIPLKYPRENFVSDLNNSLNGLSCDAKKNILEKFNLRENLDIDGIAKVNKSLELSSKEQNINSIIEKFYSNEPNIKDENVNKAINTLIKGMPEFNMTIGKVQHGTHIYSVDIHTMQVMQKSLNHPDYETLSNEDKAVLKLAILMHDFGKNGKVVTEGHASQSKIDAQKVLENYNIDNNIKDRVLNVVENHHWFEKYNKGIINAKEVKQIFKTPEDLKIAKIMAKSDLEGISSGFHKWIMHTSTQEEFDKLFYSKMDEINF